MSDYDAVFRKVSGAQQEPGNPYDALMANLTKTQQPEQNAVTPAVQKKISSESESYKAGQRAPGSLQGLLSVAQGPTFGFADELIGAGSALKGALSGDMNIGENYRRSRDFVRGAADYQSQQNPIFSAVTQGIASLPVGGVFGRFTNAAAAPIIGSVKAGGIAGGLSGLGASKADDLPGIALDTAVGAASGATLSGAASGVMRGVGAVGSNIAQRVRGSSAESAAKQKIAEALARDARGNVATSGLTNPALQTEARLAKLGPDAMIADAGGQNTRQLLDTLATLPGRTKETVANVQHQRMATEGARLRGVAQESLDTGGQRLATTVQELAASRAQAAAPYYGQLQQINITPSQALVDVVNAADQLGATQHARTLATARMQPFSIDPANPGPWNAGQLDHIKRGLDQLITRETKTDGSVTPVGVAINELRQRMISLIDDATRNPRTGDSLYKTARDAFSGPSALIDAANTGRRILSSDDATIRNALNGMSTSEIEAFRIGAYEALHNKLGSQAGRTELMNLWKNDSTREKLQAVFGDNIRSYREFAAELAKENVKRGIQKVNTGSQTAARLAGMGDLDVGAMTSAAGAVASAKAGNPIGAVAGVRDFWNRVQLPETTRDQMGRLLLQSGPTAQESLMSMRELTNRINRNNAMIYGNTGLLGGTLIGTNIQPYQQGLLGR